MKEQKVRLFPQLDQIFDRGMPAPHVLRKVGALTREDANSPEKVQEAIRKFAPKTKENGHVPKTLDDLKEEIARDSVTHTLTQEK